MNVAVHAVQYRTEMQISNPAVPETEQLHQASISCNSGLPFMLLKRTPKKHRLGIYQTVFRVYPVFHAAVH